MPELRVRNMGKRFGAVHALRDANLTVRTGEIVALLGPNGSGKSTLLECVAGLMPCDSGSVQLNGTDWPVHSRRDNLFFLPDGVQPWAEQSAGWLLRWSERAFGNVAAATMQDIRETLGVDALRHRRIGDLSKGQRKRVLLSIALSTPHQFVLMDEPFDGLDVRQTREAIALLRRVMATNRGLVVSIHNMLDAERVADRLTLLQDGSVIAEGTPMELRARAGLSHVPLDDVFLALT